MHAPGKRMLSGWLSSTTTRRLAGRARRAALDQRPAQVMEVAAAHEDGAVVGGGRHAAGRVAHAGLQHALAAAEADRLAPVVVQRQPDLAGQGADGTVGVQHDGRVAQGGLFCLVIHWLSVVKRLEKRRATARNSGLRT